MKVLGIQQIMSKNLYNFWFLNSNDEVIRILLDDCFKGIDQIKSDPTIVQHSQDEDARQVTLFHQLKLKSEVTN
jgi:hypothetical protein